MSLRRYGQGDRPPGHHRFQRLLRQAMRRQSAWRSSRHRSEFVRPNFIRLQRHVELRSARENHQRPVEVGSKDNDEFTQPERANDSSAAADLMAIPLAAPFSSIN